MTDVSDMDLVRHYTRLGSEEAFDELVRRHINLVFSVAIRQSGTPAHAEEITQVVFIILARKAASLRPDTVLEGWLYETTRLASSSFLRGERRRQWREQEAYMQSILDESNTISAWHQISPLLDEALSHLGKKDRNAIILRFFKEKKLSEVAAALKVTEGAAQRRVHRALEKLHRYFNKHGVGLDTAIIAGEISAHSVQAAPMVLAKTVTAAAVAKGTAVGVSTLTLLQGTLKLMAWAKIKITVAIAIIIICAAGSGAGVYAYHSHHLKRAANSTQASQVITLEDGTKLTLLGTSFGKHHMAPGYENLRTANWFYTPSNKTVVWIKEELKPGSNPTYQLLVFDRANTGSINIEARQRSSVKPGVFLQSFILDAYPRWDAETILRVKPYRGEVVQGEFVLSNPVSERVEPWKTKPLPDTEFDGDLEVTLTRLVAGAVTPRSESGSLMPTNDPANQCVHLNFDFRQSGQPTTNWQPWPVQTTDAFGNWSRGLIYPYPTNGFKKMWGRMKDGSVVPAPTNYVMDGYYYQPGLWPDRTWKVRLEFIRQSNFSDDEIVTFTNLPVKAGNHQDWEQQWLAWNVGKTNFPFTPTFATVKDVQLQLLPPLLLPDQYSTNHPKKVSIIIGTGSGFNPKGMNLTVVSATDDQGRELWSIGKPAWASHYSMEFPNVSEDIKSVNLTLALHKSRFVEFTVKPEKAGDATAH